MRSGHVCGADFHGIVIAARAVGIVFGISGGIDFRSSDNVDFDAADFAVQVADDVGDSFIGVAGVDFGAFAWLTAKKFEKKRKSS